MQVHRAHHARSRGAVAALLLPFVVVVTDVATAGELYRWVDDEGNVHYGDRMPADASDNEHAIMDEDGVVREERRSAAEEAAERVAREQGEADAHEADARKQRDRMLLRTFTTEEDLLRTRERRLGAIDGRIALVERQVEQLEAQQEKDRKHLQSVQSATAEGAPARGLARERLQETEKRLAARRARLAKLQAERARIAGEFAADLARFRELRARREEDP